LPFKFIAVTAIMEGKRDGVLLHVVLVQENDEAMAGIKELFVEYQEMLYSAGCDIGLFQGFDAELDGLPGKYSWGQHGCLYLLCQESMLADLSSPEIVASTTVKPRGEFSSKCIGCIALRDLVLILLSVMHLCCFLRVQEKERSNACTFDPKEGTCFAIFSCTDFEILNSHLLEACNLGHI
jgi:hypothetical protein